MLFAKHAHVPTASQSPLRHVVRQADRRAVNAAGEATTYERHVAPVKFAAQVPHAAPAQKPPVLSLLHLQV